MKRKSDISLVVGITSLALGVGIIGYSCYYNYSIGRGYINELNKGILTSDMLEQSGGGNFTLENSGTSLPVPDEIIEVLTGDQETDVVETYRNVIEIPKIDVVTYINEGVSTEALKRGVGRHVKTKKVGEIGNCVIAGHASDTFNCIFNNLKDLKLLDYFYAYDNAGVRHKYYVTSMYVCSPKQEDIITKVSDEVSVITLYTCTDSGQNRLVVVGQEFNTTQLQAFENTMHLANMNKLLEVNDGVSVNKVTLALSEREEMSSRTYVYDFPMKYTDNSYSSKDSMYSGILLDSSKDNEHKLESEFSINFGIKGVFDNDLQSN